jgi:type IV pilus assembly protein PilW
MAIGVFLIGGVVKIYANSKVSFNTRNAVADVTEIQRFALDDMRRIVVMAGRGLTGEEKQSTNTATFPLVGVGAGRIVEGGATGDTIAIRYRRGPSCGSYLNIPMTQPAAMVRFYVDGNDQLICELNNQASVLATNVYHLEALYGVDTDDNGYADNYINANAVDALSAPAGSSSPWSRVVAMQVGILAGSIGTLPREARPTPAEMGQEAVLTANIPWPDNTRIYKGAGITVELRNLKTTILK